MSVVWMCGFESGGDHADPINTGGTTSFDTGTVRTGAYSVRCNPASGAQGFVQASSVADDRWSHFAIRIATMPSVARNIFGQHNLGANVLLNTDGTLTFRNDTTSIATSSIALTTDTWYWLGVRALTGTSVVFVQVDGVDAITGTATITSPTSPNFGCNGTEASAIDLYIDDCIIDTAGFLAPSKVDVALPISDNTRTGTTAGAGGTTNLWDAVNNTPPAGVASANETNTTNIEFPASTTCDYIANLETYTTLGIVTGDTMLAAQAIVRHGEDIATGTKNLQNVGATTNPTMSGQSVLAGSDGGAHGIDTPGLWVTLFGNLQTSPSVTVGTSPTIQTSRTAETRVACIDFMGLMVAWTPAVVANPVHVNPMPQLLAH